MVANAFKAFYLLFEEMPVVLKERYRVLSLLTGSEFGLVSVYVSKNLDSKDS